MYKTETTTTAEVCQVLGYNPKINFVATMKRGNKIYVKGTCGKPEEFRQLKYDCEKFGFIYKGKSV
jgi:hypothetical protein